MQQRDIEGNQRYFDSTRVVVFPEGCDRMSWVRIFRILLRESLN